MDRGIVEFLVEDSSAVIFDCVFNGGYADDDNQRHGIETGVDAAKYGKELDRTHIGSWSTT